MQHGDAGTRARIRAAIEAGDVSAMPDIVAAIRACGSLDYSQQRARDYTAAALAALAPLGTGPHLDALRALARYAVERDR
jgi:octaprenyl-diphosphate synthase